EDHRQTAAGVRTATHEIDAFEILEAILRAHVKHLPKRMRKIEGGAVVDRHVVAPPGWRQYLLEDDAALDVLDADRLQPIECHAPKRALARRPVDVLALEIADGDQHVESRAPGRRERVVGDAGVLRVERWC